MQARAGPLEQESEVIPEPGQVLAASDAAENGLIEALNSYFELKGAGGKRWIKPRSVSSRRSGTISR
jgi:hypothetical protein